MLHLAPFLNYDDAYTVRDELDGRVRTVTFFYQNVPDTHIVGTVAYVRADSAISDPPLKQAARKLFLEQYDEYIYTDQHAGPAIIYNYWVFDQLRLSI